MRRDWVPDWNKTRAEETFKKYQGKLCRRPNGSVIYELVCVEQLAPPLNDWGIRIRNTKVRHSYIICHNMIEEEGWIEVPQNTQFSEDSIERVPLTDDSGVVR